MSENSDLCLLKRSIIELIARVDTLEQVISKMEITHRRTVHQEACLMCGNSDSDIGTSALLVPD